MKMAYEKYLQNAKKELALYLLAKCSPRMQLILELMEMNYEELRDIQRVFPKASNLVELIIQAKVDRNFQL